MLRRQLDQAQLDVVDRERLRSVGVETPKRGRGLLNLWRCTAQGQRGAPACDGHVQCRLDLAQIGVERAAKIGQRAVVYGRELQLEGLRLQCAPGSGGPMRPLRSRSTTRPAAGGAPSTLLPA